MTATDDTTTAAAAAAPAGRSLAEWGELVAVGGLVAGAFLVSVCGPILRRRIEDQRAQLAELGARLAELDQAAAPADEPAAELDGAAGPLGPLAAHWPANGAQAAATAPAADG